MKILLTGANGFLGSAIAHQAMTVGLPLIASDRNARSNVGGMDYIAADIIDPKSMTNMFNGIDCVCHVAGLAHVFNRPNSLSTSFYAVNVSGTVNVARAAVSAGVKHFIFISSVSVYGGVSLGKEESSECHPEGPYALSKWQAERTLIDLCKKEKMNLTILRLATLYGEGDPGNVGRLIQTLDKKRFLWIGDGSNRKSLLYKGDAARACVTVAQRPTSGVNIFNISAPPCTMREVVDGIGEALGKHPYPFRVPAPLALLLSWHLSRIPTRRLSGIHQTVKKWLAEDVYDTQCFEEAYGFQTETSLKQGLKQEVDWYRQNKKK